MGIFDAPEVKAPPPPPPPAPPPAQSGDVSVGKKTAKNEKTGKKRKNTRQALRRDLKRPGVNTGSQGKKRKGKSGLNI